MMPSRSIKIEPSTACSESRFWGGNRSITVGGSPWVDGFVWRQCWRCAPGPTPPTDEFGPELSPKSGRLWAERGQPLWRTAPQGRPGPASVQPADDPDQLALDPHVVVEHGRVVWVGGLKADATLFLEELLEGDRVLFHLGDDDVPVSGRLLWPDQDKVPVLDVGVDHGIAADAQDVRISRRSEYVRHRHALRRVLVCLDWAAGRDFADDRQHVRFRGRGLGHQLA